MLTESQLLGTMAVTRRKARQQNFIPPIYAVVVTIELRPSVTKPNDKREHNISDHMVSNKICTRHQELGRCTRLCKQDTAHVTWTKKITDKQPNGGKGKPITELPREDKNKHYLSLIKKIKICVCDFRRIQ